MDFARQMAKYGANLRAYGPGLQDLYSDMLVCAYDKNLTISDIYKEFPFDAIICCTKSRMFEYYNPHKDEAKGCWLPDGINTFDCVKVMLEEDYHYEKSDIWYSQFGFDLILQRHYANYVKQKKLGAVNTGWLPFSVNEEVFKPNSELQRINKIAFAGNFNSTIYPHRYVCKEELKKENLLHDYAARAKENLYIECLQKYVSHLSCSSIYNVTPAKMFEIMASGSLLFTNESDAYGLDKLFPKNCYVTYKEDYSDLVEKAQGILRSRIVTTGMAELGRKTVLEKHTDKVRIVELLNILESIKVGKLNVKV